MVNYVVEQENKGFWTPGMVCQMRPEHFRRFLYWLQRECFHGRIPATMDQLRVKRERDEVKPEFAFDGNHTKRL